MSATPKLTKKQKKALAFRQRKHVAKDVEVNGLPEMETQDIINAQVDDVETRTVEETQEKTEKIEDHPTSKKRKRDQVEKDENKTKQRFILFVGQCDSACLLASRLCRKSQIHNVQGSNSSSLLEMRSTTVSTTPNSKNCKVHRQVKGLCISRVWPSQCITTGTQAASVRAGRSNDKRRVDSRWRRQGDFSNGKAQRTK